MPRAYAPRWWVPPALAVSSALVVHRLWFVTDDAVPDRWVALVLTGTLLTVVLACVCLAAMDLDWSDSELWLGDDRCVGPEHEHSNYRMVGEELVDRLPAERRPRAWHRIRGDECPSDPIDLPKMQAETPHYMHLMACNGPAFCERDYRTLSCRQFPFSPYITADDRLIGLTYNWDFEEVCWVISNLDQVSDQYRKEFLDIYDHLLFEHPSEYDSYYWLSEDMREHFTKTGRSIPILHRDGSYYLLNPETDELTPIDPHEFPKFGPYL